MHGLLIIYINITNAYKKIFHNFFSIIQLFGEGLLKLYRLNKEQVWLRANEYNLHLNINIVIYFKNLIVKLHIFSCQSNVIYHFIYKFIFYAFYILQNF